MAYAPGNAQHIGDRQQQQDSFGFSPLSDPAFVAHAGLLGIVADGMGGLAHGAEASRTAVRAFLEVFERKAPGDAIPTVLERAARTANEAVHALGSELGTTLVAAVTRGAELYFVSVGDSHLYLVRDGQLVRLTAEHNFGAELYRQVALGNVTRAQAENHPEREHLTSYLGGEEITLLDLNVKPFPLRPGDRVLLCSDGVYRTLPPSEILDSLAQSGDDMIRACEAIVERAIARRRPHQDNATVIGWTCCDVTSAAPAPTGPQPAPAPEPVSTRPPAPGHKQLSLAFVLALLTLALLVAAGAIWIFLPRS